MKIQEPKWGMRVWINQLNGKIPAKVVDDRKKDKYVMVEWILPDGGRYRWTKLWSELSPRSVKKPVDIYDH